MAWRLVLLGAGWWCATVLAAEPVDCRGIPNDAERLRCYDTPPAAVPEDESALSQRLRHERELAGRKYVVTPLRPSYVMHTYNGSTNSAPYQAVEPDAELQSQEIKFQLSVRVRLLDEVITPSGVLWFAYTQLSFWQAYNKELSSAFRETNYEPELGVSFDTDFSVLGWRHRILSFGFAHQSNGRDEPLSRSWNRLWAGFLFERGNVAVLARPWWRVPESAEKDDNPDIEEYAGRGDIRAAYKHGEHVVSFLWRNNFRWEDNRSGLELDWSFPVGRNLKGLVQYYYGYGESLIDYNVRTNRIGIGLLVADWL